LQISSFKEKSFIESTKKNIGQENMATGENIYNFMMEVAIPILGGIASVITIISFFSKSGGSESSSESVRGTSIGFEIWKFLSQIAAVPAFFGFYNLHMRDRYENSQQLPQDWLFFLFSFLYGFFALFLIGYWGKYSYERFNSDNLSHIFLFVFVGLFSLVSWGFFFWTFYEYFLIPILIPYLVDILRGLF